MQKETGDWNAYPVPKNQIPSQGLGSTNNTVGMGMGWFAEVLLDDHDFMTLQLLVSISVLVAVIVAMLAWKLCIYVKTRSTYLVSIKSAIKRGKLYKPSVREKVTISKKAS